MTTLTLNLERTIDYEPVEAGGETLYRKHDQITAYIFTDKRIVNHPGEAMSHGVGDTAREAISKALEGAQYFNETIGPLPG